MGASAEVSDRYELVKKAHDSKSRSLQLKTRRYDEERDAHASTTQQLKELRAQKPVTAEEMKLLENARFVDKWWLNNGFNRGKTRATVAKLVQAIAERKVSYLESVAIGQSSINAWVKRNTSRFYHPALLEFAGVLSHACSGKQAMGLLTGPRGLGKGKNNDAGKDCTNFLWPPSLPAARDYLKSRDHDKNRGPGFSELTAIGVLDPKNGIIGHDEHVVVGNDGTDAHKTLIGYRNGLHKAGEMFANTDANDPGNARRTEELQSVYLEQLRPFIPYYANRSKHMHTVC
jgi:hypothetical protein